MCIRDSCNYDELVTTDDGSCEYVDGICDTCENGEIIDNDIDNDTVCNEDEIPGCQDETACNFNPDATDDANNCTYPEQYYDCDGVFDCSDGILLTLDMYDSLGNGWNLSLIHISEPTRPY